MDLIKLTKENLETEHICCAISNNNDVQVSSKKAWLRERLDEGLVFLKGDVRGKCFIEYIPAEFAWAPVNAADYMFINCFWVSGQYKGHGNANLLLQGCINDSKQKSKKGLCVVSSAKKKPFLSDPKYLAYKGFAVADTADPFFELLYLPFEKTAQIPQFLPCAKAPQIDVPGIVIYYSAQCPYTAKYVPLLENVAKSYNLPVKINKIETLQQAKSAPCAVTSYALFSGGKYITNELMSEKKFADFCSAVGENK